ncbi:MAG: flagellar basal-body rod protein FlgF [Rhodospirillaceae bacterium]|nr:flagellar basal-body rod protein FlgF [Rhodospirillaceae bacterium]
MDNASYIVLSRQAALSRQIDVIANNIANGSTPAFKGESVVFTEYLEKVAGGPSLSFVQDRGTARNTTEGPLTATNNPLDLAIRGEGYFVVQTARGNRYTRAGNFSLDAQGRLVTHDGDPVLSTTGTPFTLRPTDGPMTVSRDGVVSAGQRVLGRLDIVTFARPQLLQATAGGLYTTTESPTPVAKPDVVQGMLEGSNVEPIIEMTRMIELMRSFKAAQVMLEAEDDRQRRAIATIVSSNA